MARDDKQLKYVARHVVVSVHPFVVVAMHTDGDDEPLLPKQLQSAVLHVRYPAHVLGANTSDEGFDKEQLNGVGGDGVGDGVGGTGVTTTGEGVTGVPGAGVVVGADVPSVPWDDVVHPYVLAGGQVMLPLYPLRPLRSALPALPSDGQFTVVPLTVTTSRPDTHATGKHRTVLPDPEAVNDDCIKVLSKQRLLEPYVSP